MICVDLPHTTPHTTKRTNLSTNLSTTANMAAVTAGRPSRRKSRRVASACAFLSNISLDGNIGEDAVKVFKTEKNVVNRSHETVAGNIDMLSPKQRTVLHSISEPGTSEGNETNVSGKNVHGKVIHRHRSVTDVVSERKQQERSAVIRRSVSMSESNDSSSTSGSVHRSKHRVSCLTGSSFHHKRRATDKR